MLFISFTVKILFRSLLLPPLLLLAISATLILPVNVSTVPVYLFIRRNRVGAMAICLVFTLFMPFSLLLISDQKNMLHEIWQVNMRCTHVDDGVRGGVLFMFQFLIRQKKVESYARREGKRVCGIGGTN